MRIPHAIMHLRQIRQPTQPAHYVSCGQGNNTSSRSRAAFRYGLHLYIQVGPQTNKFVTQSYLLLDQALHLWAVEQDALAKLLRRLAVADGAKVKNLCIMQC